MTEEQKPVELTPEQEETLNDFAFFGTGVIVYLETQVHLGFLKVTHLHIDCCVSCGSNEMGLAFWHPSFSSPICYQCPQCGTLTLDKHWYQKFYEKQKWFKERLEKGEKMPEIMEKIAEKVENEMEKQEAKSVEFLCDYIDEHASQIYVQEQVNGQWGSYALTELPASLAIKHILGFIKKGNMPVRKKEESPDDERPVN